jgi:hypothetical protein
VPAEYGGLLVLLLTRGIDWRVIVMTVASGPGIHF